MSWFSSTNNNKPNEGSDGSDKSEPFPASWRDEKVENPFDDPKVRRRIADLIIRSVVKPDKFGA